MKKKLYVNQREVSTLGFGAWPLGNTAHGKTMTDEEGIELVKKAYESGVNFFDTAPNYAHGRSETILGKALEGIRENVVINTKFGHHPDGEMNFDETLMRDSIEGSLTRLKTDYLDSVILHNPGHDVLQGKTGHFDILQTLKEEGLIKGYGVSIDTPEDLNYTLNHVNVDVIELLYNVFAQSTREYLTQIEDRKIALIIKVPLDSGWLAGKYTKASTFSDIRSRWTDEDKQRRDTLINQLKSMVGPEPLTRYTLGFLWSYDAITTVIPGIRTIEQLKDHLASWQFSFPITLRPAFEHFYDEKIKNDPLPW